MKLLLTQGYKEITTELETLFKQNGITISKNGNLVKLERLLMARIYAY